MDFGLESLRDLSPHARRWSLILVMVCGAMLGYFVLRTFASPLHRQYQLDFGTAQWIEPAEFTPVGYFRRDISLNTAPEQAWLEVAATDSFEAFVNGKKIGTESNPKTRIAQIYDIKTLLKPGTNVIAISVNRVSYPGSAQLLVSGSFKEPGNKPTSFVSDEHWRVTPKTGIVQGTEEWISPLVQEEVWPNARRVTNLEHPVHVTWVDTNPLLLQLPVAGKWITAETASREAIFSTSVNAERARPETWIQVASAGNLDLLVNGKLTTATAASQAKQPNTPSLPKPTSESLEKEKGSMASPPAAVVRPQQNAKPPESPGPSATPGVTPMPTASESVVESMATSSEEPTLDAYDISYWIKKGPNTIIAAVRNDQGPASFLASGFMIQKDARITGFESNASWRTGNHQSDHEQHAVETGNNGTAPWGYLKQKPGNPVNLSDFDAVAKPIAVILLTIIGTVALWLLASRLVAFARKEPLRDSLARDAVFHGAIAVGLIFLLLPKYDIRFPVDWPFKPAFVGLAAAGLLAIRLLHFAPRRGIAANLVQRIRQIRDTMSFDPLPYVLLAASIGLGFAFRYSDLGAMSFDPDEYSMGPERFLSAAMPVHGYADFLVLLRGNKNSALQPKVPDSCDCHVLRYLSVMGRKRVHRARPGCCVVRSTLGGIMVAKKLASLPLSVFYDCVGDRAVLLAHARNVDLPADRIQQF